MPDLLQAITEREAVYLADLAAVIESEVRDLDAQPHPQLGRVLRAASGLTRHLANYADSAEVGLADLEATLRAGVSRDRFQPLAQSAAGRVRWCLETAEIAGRLWDRAEQAGAPADEVAAGRDALAAARSRILAVKPKTDRYAALAAATPPDIDPALLERGAQQIREGKFFTPEQAIEYFRRPRG